MNEYPVIIVGAGIGGLTTALELQQRGIEVLVLEASATLSAVGVGINLLPHATQVLHNLGVLEELEQVAVVTKESAFFNRFGQLVYREPAGRFAGYDMPQLSIHRGDLQMVLLNAVRERVGTDAIRTGHRAIAITQTADGVTVKARLANGEEREFTADAVIGADGVHSAVRTELGHTNTPQFTGYMMWRGTTIMPPFLSGASMVRAGWLTHGKLVIYPVRDQVNAEGHQLVNWVAEVEGPMRDQRDWNREGELSDFAQTFADWDFDWLDVPAMLRDAEQILEYPMVDQDPLDSWTVGRVTLLGDAAHPMVPRGSNGAAQSILDAQAIANHLAQAAADKVGVPEALQRYEDERLPATSNVVLTNRVNPPDAILREVYERTGDQPFDHIDDVISPEELRRRADAYRTVVGIDTEA